MRVGRGAIVCGHLVVAEHDQVALKLRTADAR